VEEGERRREGKVVKGREREKTTPNEQ